MSYNIQIRKIEHVTPNVLHIITDKPEGYGYAPGQATEMSIDQDGWRNEKRPFTFTGLPEDDELEFTIKEYPDHDGVTEALGQLEVGDTLQIGEAWGAITYQGPGAFIAGGAGITPFVAIMKNLAKKGELKGNQLFFANKTEKDIIYKNNLETWLGDEVYHILSNENHDAHAHGQLSKDFLEQNHLNVDQKVYLCGPPPMMDAVQADLFAMGLHESQLIMEDLE